ncbi:hypothetical protein OROMI_026282 [Orobanche minor]
MHSWCGSLYSSLILGRRYSSKPNFRMLPCSDRGCSGCYERQSWDAVWKWTLVAGSDAVWNQIFVSSGRDSFKCFSSRNLCLLVPGHVSRVKMRKIVRRRDVHEWRRSYAEC